MAYVSTCVFQCSSAAYRKQAKQKAQQEEELRSKLPKLDKYFKPQVLQQKIEMEGDFEKTGKGKSSNLYLCSVWKILN